MRNEERFIYAIFTLDENKTVTGVYVGSTNDIKSRIEGHLSRKKPICEKQDELHEIMRTGAFVVKSLGMVQYKDRWVEYDWIRFFRDYTNYKVYNTLVDCYEKEAKTASTKEGEE